MKFVPGGGMSRARPLLEQNGEPGTVSKTGTLFAVLATIVNLDGFSFYFPVVGVLTSPARVVLLTTNVAVLPDGQSSHNLLA
jgi:hypothetical protein